MGVTVRRHLRKFTTVLNVLELYFIKRQAVDSKRRVYILYLYIRHSET